MTESVEQLDLFLGVVAHVVVLGQRRHELADARPELVREVRRRRAYERVDVVAGGLAFHRRKTSGRG